ncbi:hypothetical protein [Spirosoma pomorum]
MDNKALGLQIVANLESHYKVDLSSIINNSDLSYQESIKQFKNALIGAVNAHQGFQSEEGDNTNNASDGPEEEPNIFMSRYNANIVADYTGDKVRTYVTSVSKTLENLAVANSVGQFVAETLGGTFLAVGIPVAIKVAARLIAKDTLNVALSTAIKGVGLKSAIAAVVLALAGILYWLIWEKEAKILGVIINDTDTDYYVPNWRLNVNGYSKGNLYMEYGTTENFMVGHLTGNIDSPEVQLKSRFPDINDEETMVAAGLYYADRKAGFLGAEGIYVFIPRQGSDIGFAYQFAVPYSKSNRANLSVYSGGEITDKSVIQGMFRNLYNENKVGVDFTSGNCRFRSHIQSPSGGVICGLVSVSTPIIYRED